LLPHVEQGVLYQVYNFNVSWNNAANANVINKQLAVFQCPSVPKQNRTYVSNGLTVAACDYGVDNAINTSGLFPLGLVANVANSEGVAKVNFLCKVAHITDGTSNTLVIAEDAGGRIATASAD
jgi:hypothetical protein